jgi:protein-tyrosine-phosphatase
MENPMKTILTAITITLLLIGAFAEEDHHSHNKSTAKEKSGHSKSSLVLNNGKKWPADQDMKENMDAIYQQFRIFSELSKSKKSTNEDAQKLSVVINTSAKNIISKCKMEKKQDEAFHVLLTDLFTVAADLEKTGKVDSALENLARTLKNYTKYFDHSLSI